ncbi:LysR family transcriptional regulator [Pseudomonas paraversuta]|uniref:LysR family transcriptional regulator n=1 Tax=Pseudomonas TaxID=286 RepID=UPI0002897FFD|nr:MULTISPECIES: LysR family transcriptional regulator [Pseudomonas]AMB80922.1 LysR family transcriptional regulator [Pseudomonas fragi]MCH4868954.1 LysR family transcriptional regulator [Pseudomonas sp. TMW22089]NBF13827.1 LysR family transcriptional regulator [Pseudomonas sp. Fl4BN2]NBG93927.1 LysR family transcriptional regulator [Pseudomonas sp. 9.1(2019)]NNG61345.1 LysR family transcriptional regulator [Pseudomonas sp. GC01]
MLLRNIDLNLLVVLDALLTEKHVTRTGVRLHLSQPAISHSLNKLRVLLDDPLLIRQGNEVVLSALAQNLQAPLKEILGQIETLLGQSIDFVPADSQRTLRIAMSDYGAAIVLPKLLVQLRAQAPGTSLVVIQDSRLGMLEQVGQGRIDLAIGVFPAPGADICTEVLFEETFTCLLDRRSLPENGVLDLDSYLARPHLLVSMDGNTRGEVDNVLRARGLKRRVAVNVPHWGTAPGMIADTDLILTVATRTLTNVPFGDTLVAMAPPLTVAPFNYVQAWHNRFNQDPAHRWLRELVRQVSA